MRLCCLNQHNLFINKYSSVFCEISPNIFCDYLEYKILKHI